MPIGGVSGTAPTGIVSGKAAAGPPRIPRTADTTAGITGSRTLPTTPPPAAINTSFGSYVPPVATCVPSIIACVKPAPPAAPAIVLAPADGRKARRPPAARGTSLQRKPGLIAYSCPF